MPHIESLHDVISFERPSKWRRNFLFLQVKLQESLKGSIETFFGNCFVWYCLCLCVAGTAVLRTAEVLSWRLEAVCTGTVLRHLRRVRIQHSSVKAIIILSFSRPNNCGMMWQYHTLSPISFRFVTSDNYALQMHFNGVYRSHQLSWWSMAESLWGLYKSHSYNCTKLKMISKCYKMYTYCICWHL